MLYTSNGLDAGENGVSLTTDGEYLYEITSNGGDYNMGVLFKIKIDGSGFEKLLDFNEEIGGVPQDPLNLSEGFLYGTTAIGGPNKTGAVFRIKTDGTGFENLIDFKSCFDLPATKSAMGANQIRRAALPDATASDAGSTLGFITLADNSIYIVATEQGPANDLSRVFKFDITPAFDTPSPSLLEFGNVDINTNSAPKSFVLTGTNFSDNVNVIAPNGFQVAASQNGPFEGNLSLTPNSGLLNSTVYVRFSPSQAENYTANVAIESAGAHAVYVTVNGTGVAHNECPAVATPAGFLASQGVLCDHVHLEWEAVSGAANYALYRGNTLLTTTTGLSYDDYAATATPATYNVYAKSDCATSLPGTTKGYTATLPVIQLGEDFVIHTDTVLTLDAGEGFTAYDWSTGATDQTLVLDGLASGSYTYSVVITDQHGCSATDTINVTVDITTWIKTSVGPIYHSLFPNPSSGKTYFEISEGTDVSEFTVSVYSVSGKLVNSFVLPSSGGPLYKLNLKQAPGIYEVIIQYGRQVLHDKLIIK